MLVAHPDSTRSTAFIASVSHAVRTCVIAREDHRVPGSANAPAHALDRTTTDPDDDDGQCDQPTLAGGADAARQWRRRSGRSTAAPTGLDRRRNDGGTCAPGRAAHQSRRSGSLVGAGHVRSCSSSQACAMARTSAVAEAIARSQRTEIGRRQLRRHGDRCARATGPHRWITSRRTSGTTLSAGCSPRSSTRATSPSVLEG